MEWIELEKLEGKRPLGRTRHGWENNIKVDLLKYDVGVWTGSSWGYLKERDHLGDPGIDGRIILRWIF
jgi:hypothetical protein